MINWIIFYICLLNFFVNYTLISKLKYIIYILISIFCLFIILKNIYKFRFERKNLIFIFCIFMISTIPSSILMFGNKNASELFSPYIRIYLLIPILIYINIYISTEKIISSLVKFSVPINAISFFQILKDKSDFGRIQSVFSHPNFYAFYLIVIILSIIYLIKEKKLNKKLAIIYFFINLILIIAAGSKTAFLALSVVLLYLFLKFILKANNLLKFPLVIITILLSILVLFLFKDKLLDLRIFNINYGLQDNQINSYAWRFLNWKSKFEFFGENIFSILFGLGWGSEILYGFYGFAMHNEYLRIIFETGLIGNIILLIFTFIFISNIKSLKNKNIKEFFISFFIVILIGSLSENIFVAVETTVLYLSLIFSINLSKKNY
ncbi:oligosaccharide repeat unit polymerase [Clostridium perfringens]|nr:oligosaccharide repeat unit polymerase [Clostridium perfringens]